MENDENKKKTSHLEWLEAKITPKALNHYFAYIGAAPITCPICHKAEFTIPSKMIKVDGETVTRIVISKANDEFSNMNEDRNSDYQFRLICKSCGCQTYFSVSPIISWFRDGPVFDEGE